ncbi:hypothetical protein l13_09890 [Neisseria weaveri ATCC 51223]|nr:hypothetical protein l13_09890 [Neisseria weaveri ATCC 51223]
MLRLIPLFLSSAYTMRPSENMLFIDIFSDGLLEITKAV